MTSDMQRRRFVRGIGAVALAGALAGCSGGGDGAATGGGDGGDSASVPGEIDSYLNDNDANQYGGNAADMTGQDSVDISVGAGNQGYAFDPAAVVVSAGTEVNWVWTGNGGQHNIVADDGTFESERMSSAGSSFSHTFEDAGNYGYKCVPHQALGMYGAVVVE